MEINQFQELLKICKKQDLDYGNQKRRITVDPQRLRWTISRIRDEKKKFCSQCGAAFEDKSVVVILNSPIDSLTIFQANMLYNIFAEGKIPYDYAKYHECTAGKEFIKNIKEVKVQ